MSAKHTPGPWASTSAGVVAAGVTGANVICEAPIHYLESAKNWLANAALIAAAPDMLAALLAQQEADRLHAKWKQLIADRAYLRSPGNGWLKAKDDELSDAIVATEIEEAEVKFKATKLRLAALQKAGVR